MKQSKPQPYTGSIRVGHQFRIKSDNNIIEVVTVSSDIVCTYIVSDTKKGLMVAFNPIELEKKLKFGYFIKIN